MSLLPWLLDWPPSRRSVAVFVVVTAVSVGTIVVFSGVVDRPDEGNVTVEAVDVTVALNDEVSYPEGGDGSVQTCLASGTPGDSVSVIGDVIVDVPEPDGLRPAAERRLNVTVSLAHTDETTAGTVEGPGTETHDVFWVLEDDESLTAGENETIQVWVSQDGTPIANATRTVPVEAGSRTYDCD